MAFSNRPQSLDQLLKSFMQRLPRRTEFKRGMVLHLWPEIVGEQVARTTKNLEFERGRLIVTVESESWRHELHMNRFSIRKKLNSRVGGEIVKEIVIRC